MKSNRMGLPHKLFQGQDDIGTVSFACMQQQACQILRSCVQASITVRCVFMFMALLNVLEGCKQACRSCVRV